MAKSVSMCTLLYTPLLLVRDYDQQTTVTSSSHACYRLSLADAVSACADQQFGTHSHRICEAQTLGKSLSVAQELAIRVCIRQEALLIDVD